MARHKIVHSEDSAAIIIRGNKSSPEPSTAVIKFPGGHVEVSRCSDGSYWCHFQRCVTPSEDDAAGVITESRVDYTPQAWAANGGAIPPLPKHGDIQHIAVRIAKATGGAQ